MRRFVPAYWRMMEMNKANLGCWFDLLKVFVHEYMVKNLATSRTGLAVAVPRKTTVLEVLPRFRDQFPEASFRESVPEPGSGPEALRLRVQKVPCPRFRRFRCSMCSDRFGSVSEVWTEPVPEMPLPTFRKLRKFQRLRKFRENKKTSN